MSTEFVWALKEKKKQEKKNKKRTALREAVSNYVEFVWDFWFNWIRDFVKAVIRELRPFKIVFFC